MEKEISISRETLFMIYHDFRATKGNLLTFRETFFTIYHELFSLQIFAKPFLSQETIPLQTLKEDYIYSLMKKLQVPQTILFGKIPQETASFSILEVLLDGGLV